MNQNDYFDVPGWNEFFQKAQQNPFRDLIESGSYNLIVQNQILFNHKSTRIQGINFLQLAILLMLVHRYQDAIELLKRKFEFMTHEEQIENQCIQGFCYYFMKQYKISQNIFDKNTDIFQWLNKLIQYQLSFDKNIFEEDSGFEILNTTLISYFYFMMAFCQIFHKQIRCFPNNTKIKQNTHQNITLLIEEIRHILDGHFKKFIDLYSCLFQLLYYLDCQQNKKILSNLVTLMIQSNSINAKGYENLYQLLIHSNFYQEAYDLNRQLLECHDTPSKYKALAKLHYDVEEFEQALEYLEIGLTLNQFDDEIYQQLITIKFKIKQYESAYTFMENFIRLEKENIVLIMSYVNSFINQYEYHKAWYVLHLADEQNSQLMSKIKLLYQILIYPSSLNQLTIPEIIDQLPYSTTAQYCEKVLFQAHFMLKKLDFQGAQARYHYLTTPLKNLKNQEELDRTQSILQKLQSQKELCFIAIHNEICQNIVGYVDESSQYIISRYMNCLSYLICQFINNSSDTTLIEQFNLQNDSLMTFQNQQSIPSQITLLSILEKAIEKFYNYYKISSDQYCQRIIRAKNDFRARLKDFNYFYDEMKLFCQKYEKELLENVNSMQFEYVWLRLDITELFNYQFFHDPISKLCLVQFIKLVGYFSEFSMYEHGIDDIQQFLYFSFVKQNIQGFFESLITLYKGKI